MRYLYVWLTSFAEGNLVLCPQIITVFAASRKTVLTAHGQTMFSLTRKTKLCPADTNTTKKPLLVDKRGFFVGGERGIFSPSLRSVGRKTKRSTGAFLCRSRLRCARRALPFVVRIPLLLHKKTTPTRMGGSCFFGGERGIRTLERLITVTRVPVVRLRPAQPSLRVVTNAIIPHVK